MKKALLFIGKMLKSAKNISGLTFGAFFGSKSEKASPAETEREKTFILQNALGNRQLISRRARARPLARTNETKRFPGWGHYVLTPPNLRYTHGSRYTYMYTTTMIITTPPPPNKKYLNKK